MRGALDESVIQPPPCPASDLLDLVLLEVDLVSLGVSPLDSGEYDFFDVEVETHADGVGGDEVRSDFGIELSGLLLSALRRKSAVNHGHLGTLLRLLLFKTIPGSDMTFFLSFLQVNIGLMLLQLSTLIRLVTMLALEFPLLKLVLDLFSQLVQGLHRKLNQAVSLFDVLHLKDLGNELQFAQSRVPPFL
jgi:hypothetical protein